jgi:hypothetical protein
VITEHVAGGDVRDAETLGDTGSLGALAGTGRTDEEELHCVKLRPQATGNRQWARDAFWLIA